MSATTLPTMFAADAAMAAGLYQHRVNDAYCKIVNQAISVQSNFNTICAIEYMKSHNVNAAVIERVLLHPEQRRK